MDVSVFIVREHSIPDFLWELHKHFTTKRIEFLPLWRTGAGAYAIVVSVSIVSQPLSSFTFYAESPIKPRGARNMKDLIVTPEKSLWHLITK